MQEDKRHADTGDIKAADSENEDAFRSDDEGMSTATALIAIDRKVRKKLMEDYDILEIRNEGRYYAASARSKDGSKAFELMIDKQSGNVRVYDEKRIG